MKCLRYNRPHPIPLPNRFIELYEPIPDVSSEAWVRLITSGRSLKKISPKVNAFATAPSVNLWTTAWNQSASLNFFSNISIPALWSHSILVNTLRPENRFTRVLNFSSSVACVKWGGQGRVNDPARFRIHPLRFSFFSSSSCGHVLRRKSSVSFQYNVRH